MGVGKYYVIDGCCVGDGFAERCDIMWLGVVGVGVVIDTYGSIGWGMMWYFGDYMLWMDAVLLVLVCGGILYGR